MTNEAELESRIRERAHKIWLDAGCPEGQAERHWELARLVIAEEDGKASALRDPSLVPAAEPVLALENQGEFPTLTDQGEQQLPGREEAEAVKVAPPEEGPKRRTTPRKS